VRRARSLSANRWTDSEVQVSFHFAGYFSKKIASRDAWLQAPAVTQIWSVSECISKGPENWIQKWRHNDLWLFDTPELAESVVAAGERHLFATIGYRIWHSGFDAGREDNLTMADAGTAVFDPAFQSLGFDAVVRSLNGFGCSPLSCNGAAATHPTNERCLFPTVEAAIAGAKEFSAGTWEPGVYWVVEVLGRRGGTV
jgi:hypothetical protein